MLVRLQTTAVKEALKFQTAKFPLAFTMELPQKGRQRQGGKKGQSRLRATAGLSLSILKGDQKHAELLLRFCKNYTRLHFIKINLKGRSTEKNKFQSHHQPNRITDRRYKAQ